MHGFSIGSSAEAVRYGRLFPLRPYTTHINTFHVPTVESTLLQNFLRGTDFTRIAPVVFQDTLERTTQYLHLGGHLEYKVQLDYFLIEPIIKPPPLANQQEQVVVPLFYKFVMRDLIWTPRNIAVLLSREAASYSILLSLYLRVNGANAIYRRSTGHATPVGRTETLAVKVDEFVQLARALDSLEDPSDECITLAGLNVKQLAKPGGPTDFKDDCDLIRIDKIIIPIEPTPLQVLATPSASLSGISAVEEYQLAEFREPVELAIDRLAYAIQTMKSDAMLIEEYVDPASAFDYYYPMIMKDAAQCRLHSRYLACLTMINKAWEETTIKIPTTTENDHEEEQEEEEDEIDEKSGDESNEDGGGERKTKKTTTKGGGGKKKKKEIPAKRRRGDEMPLTDYIAGRAIIDPPGHNDGFRHSLAIRHAFHRCMGSYVSLFYHALRDNKISDESWKSDIENAPSIFDCFFPTDTACFHWGDLPSLNCLLEHVGLVGVQVVKNKIPIIRILMKSLPVCCQSRDLVKCFLKECRAASSEGYWRVVRSMFFCTLAGLYPGSVHRADFRSMMRLYHMIFKDRNEFFTALEREIVENKSRPKGKKLNKACQLVYVVFREYFIYLSSRNSGWIRVVDKHIKWEQFVINTLKSADEMRRCARFADAPRGNEFQFAINALFRCKDDHPLNVYRYRKKEYVQMLLDKFNYTQDGLHESHRLESEEIQSMQSLMQRIVDQEILDAIDLAPLVHSRHLKSHFRNDPLGFYESCTGLPSRDGSDFHIKLEEALEESRDRYKHLDYELDDDTKRNIYNYLLRTRPEDHFNFGNLLDPRLGGVSRESVQAMYKTKHVYETRSSPKSIETYVSNLQIRDFRIFSWYFNIVSRIERFKTSPLPADMVEMQALAFRRYRFHLLPTEPLPPSAWTVYICFCCCRVASFSDTATYGTFRISYDSVTRNMVCGKKVSRVARARAKANAAAAINNNNNNNAADQQQNEEEEPIQMQPIMDNLMQEDEEPSRADGMTTTTITTQTDTAAAEADRLKREEDARKKKARAERRDTNAIPCQGQPVIPVVLKGCALEFGGDRYLFCPNCGQLHTYKFGGWGRRGYRCQACRAKETPAPKLQRCAFCGNADRGHPLKTMDILCPGEDPCAPPRVDVEIDVDTGEERKILHPVHNPVADPLSCYQTLHFCQKDANSAGLFAKHYIYRHYMNMSKEELWKLIPGANVTRQLKQYNKYN